MQKCPNCGTLNRVGVLICENCSTNLVTGKAQASTKALSGNELSPEVREPLQKQGATDYDLSLESPLVRGTDEFPKGGTLRLEIEGSSKSVQVPLTVHHREIVLGRRDPATGALPDIDLTPFAGYRMGVSRRHSLIRYSEGKFLDLFDQGSSNGTFLNGQRMDAHYPYRLHNGDRLRLGQITVRVHFEPSSSVAASATASEPTVQKATAPLGKKPEAPSTAKPATGEMAKPGKDSKKAADEAKAPQAPAAPKPKVPSPSAEPAKEASTDKMPSPEPKIAPEPSKSSDKTDKSAAVEQEGDGRKEAMKKSIERLSQHLSDAKSKPKGEATANQSDMKASSSKKPKKEKPEKPTPKQDQTKNDQNDPKDK